MGGVWGGGGGEGGSGIPMSVISILSHNFLFHSFLRLL